MSERWGSTLVWPLKCMLEGGSTQKELYQTRHSEPFKTGGIRTKKWNPWRASLEETIGQFFQELLKLSLLKTWGKKSANQKAHLKIGCSWPSCILHQHPQVNEEEFECFEQKIVAKHVRANFSAGQSSGSHSKKDP